MVNVRTRGGVYVGRRRSGAAPPPPPSGGGTGFSGFSANSALNKQIPTTVAIHPSTNLMISASNNWLLGGTSNDAFKEWIGPRQRVYYWRGNFSSLTNQSVFINFRDNFGYVCGTTPVSIPLDSGNSSSGVGAAMLAGTSFDGISWFADDATGDVWCSYRLTPPGMASKDISCSSSRWNSVRFDRIAALEVNGLGYGYGFSASASGIWPGLGMIRRQDMVDLTHGGYMPHALRLNGFIDANGTNFPKFVAPAGSGADGQQLNGIPQGARIQLDPSIDVTSWASILAKADPWRSALMKICRTLQVYGMVIVDSSGGPGAGGIESEYGASAAAAGVTLPWLASTSNMGWSYSNGIPYDLMSHFRVIDWRVGQVANAFTGA